ncbi:MAG: hypothetical protein GF330_00535 [Candidatus Eisenbacteria bacterium]|nr:hypothetical protein [Candidatus Eisenbacteria bacterium]
MNVVDVVVLAIIAISALLSLRVGLIRELFALGSLLIGIAGAAVLSRTYGNQIPDLLGNSVATQVAFFAVCFLGVYLLVGLIGRLIARTLRVMRLGAFDHLLGLVFGAVRGALIAFLLLALLVFILPQDHALLRGSHAYDYARGPLRSFAELLPDRAREVLRQRPKLDRLLPSRGDGGEDRPRGIPL